MITSTANLWTSGTSTEAHKRLEMSVCRLILLNRGEQEFCTRLEFKYQFLELSKICSSSSCQSFNKNLVSEQT